MAKSPPNQLSIFDLPTFQDLTSVISSPGSGVGAKHYTSRDGRLIVLSGQGAARASRSRSRARAQEPTTPATSGPTSTASSPPADPLSSWGSRLRERLGTDGSMEFELIWKEVATPAGRQIFRLSRSTPRTFASASTGSHSTWPTPRSSDEKNGNGKTGNRTPEAAHKAGWTLPELTRATWPTPVANPDNKTPEAHLAMKLRMGERDGTHSNRTAITDLQVMAKAFGTTTFGSPDQTAKPGALNPAFPCWLMGYPTEWESCAPTATPSSHKSRRK